MNNFKVYSSSAGSGKTYTLTREYLKLALQNENPDYFRHILAITFTNDAANEMKERIVKTLQTFTLAPPEAPPQMLVEIAQELAIPTPILQQRAEQVFYKIIYNYADFAVSTIDKFVNKIVNAFTQELDIPYNYEIDLDTIQLIQATTDRVVDRVGRKDREENVALSEAVIAWTKQKIENQQRWQNIQQELNLLAKELMNENAYDFVQSLKHFSVTHIISLAQDLQLQMQALLQEIQTMAQQVCQEIAQNQLTEKDFYQGTRGIYGFFQKMLMQDKVASQDLEGKYLNETLEKDKWQGGSKVILDVSLTKAWKEVALQIIAKVKKYRFLALIQPRLYPLALIQTLEKEMQAVKQENNTIHISDNNRKIAQIVATEPVPFIYERVGEKYNHILIDEFQDTSILQWENLLPLVENNLGKGFFNLIVGDAKQAIYRWRGGELEQLVHLYQNNIQPLIEKSKLPTEFVADRYYTLSYSHQADNLMYNYRSSEEIVNFNNDFFGFMSKKYSSDNTLLAQIYSKEGYMQYLPQGNKIKQGGYVEFCFLQKDKDIKDIKKENLNEKNLLKIIAIIQKAQAEGFALRDIAILTRQNSEAKEVANFLQAQGIEVISQISLLLKTEPKIQFLVAMLHLVNAPEERLYKAEVLYFFYTFIKKQNIDASLNQQIRNIVTQPIAALYQLLAQEGHETTHYQLLQLSLYELTEKIIEIFQLLQDKQGLPYIFRFLDVVLQFSLQKNTTLSDFLAYWEEKKQELSINTPKEKEAVIITSIHKSKGLEYPTVIVPFAYWENTPKSRSTFWAYIPEEYQPLIPQTGKKLPCVWLSMNTDLEKTPFSEQYLAEKQSVFIENLNLLYVAFTRPIYQLYVITHNHFSKEGADKNINYWFKEYLNSQHIWREEQETFVVQQSDKTPAKTEQAVTINHFEIENYISTDVHKKVRKNFSTPKNATTK